MKDAIQLIGVDKYFKFGRSHRTLFSFFKKKLNGPYYPSHLLSALKDINLQIKKGEKIGIIGNNGAGKTTLLKTIGGLYKASNGRLIINGDLVMLSGLGTGMLSELTVKENLFLYGAIYRINRSGILAKLDEILEWAELSAFENAQLKTLSAGMKTRLAFSIMRHIKADIFLLDEALTAGDKNFQTKCNQFFEECKQQDTTFLVSTHNLSLAQSFCSKIIWLHKGEILAFGDTSDVLQWYKEGTAQFLEKKNMP